jgi:hypothetical protein
MKINNSKIEFTKTVCTEILNLVTGGMDLSEAWDQILGTKGLTYSDFVSDLYDKLKASN